MLKPYDIGNCRICRRRLRNRRTAILTRLERPRAIDAGIAVQIRPSYP
jgi:hypothetical protein